MRTDVNRHGYIKTWTDRQLYSEFVNYIPSEEKNTYGHELLEEVTKRSHGDMKGWKSRLEQETGISSQIPVLTQEYFSKSDSVHERIRGKYKLFLLNKDNTDKGKRDALSFLFRHRKTKESIEKADYLKISYWYKRMKKQAEKYTA